MEEWPQDAIGHAVVITIEELRLDSDGNKVFRKMEPAQHFLGQSLIGSGPADPNERICRHERTQGCRETTNTPLEGKFTRILGNCHR